MVNPVSGDVRVGGAYFTFSAQAGPYVTGVGQVVAANQALHRSMASLDRQSVALAAGLDRIAVSARSSVIATIGYTLGVGLLNGVLRSSVGGALAYDEALIGLQKTSGLAADTLGDVLERVERLGTVGIDGARALGIARESLFDIAQEWARQGIRNPDDIVGFTRIAAQLELATNLVGVDAVRALSRVITVMGLGAAETERFASAIVHVGNNIAADEDAIANFLRSAAIAVESTGGFTPALTLGLAARLTEVGEEPQKAATVLQRIQRQLLDIAQTDELLFEQILRSAGKLPEEAQAIRAELISGRGVLRETNDEIALAFLGYIASLGQVTDDATQGVVTELLRTLSDGENNVRIQAIIGALTKNFPRTLEIFDFSQEGFESGNRHIIEAENAAEAYRSRLKVVGNEIVQFGTDVGEFLVPALTRLAEAWDLVAAAALGALGIFTARGIRNAVGPGGIARRGYDFVTGAPGPSEVAERAKQQETLKSLNNLYARQRAELDEALPRYKELRQAITAEGKVRQRVPVEARTLGQQIGERRSHRRGSVATFGVNNPDLETAEERVRLARERVSRAQARVGTGRSARQIARINEALEESQRRLVASEEALQAVRAGHLRGVRGLTEANEERLRTARGASRALREADGARTEQAERLTRAQEAGERAQRGSLARSRGLTAEGVKRLGLARQENRAYLRAAATRDDTVERLAAARRGSMAALRGVGRRRTDISGIDLATGRRYDAGGPGVQLERSLLNLQREEHRRIRRDVPRLQRVQDNLAKLRNDDIDAIEVVNRHQRRALLLYRRRLQSLSFAERGVQDVRNIIEAADDPRQPGVVRTRGFDEAAQRALKAETDNLTLATHRARAARNELRLELQRNLGHINRLNQGRLAESDDLQRRRVAATSQQLDIDERAVTEASGRLEKARDSLRRETSRAVRSEAGRLGAFTREANKAAENLRTARDRLVRGVRRQTVGAVDEVAVNEAALGVEVSDERRASRRNLSQVAAAEANVRAQALKDIERLNRLETFNLSKGKERVVLAGRIAAAEEELKRIAVERRALEQSLATQVARRTRLLNRLRTVLNLMGGPLGAIFLALTIGAAAWRRWAAEAGEASRRADGLASSLDKIAENLARPPNLTEFQYQLFQTTRNLRELEVQLAAAEARRAAFIDGLSTPRGTSRLIANLFVPIIDRFRTGDSVAELERQIENTRRAIEKLERNAGLDAETLLANPESIGEALLVGLGRQTHTQTVNEVRDLYRGLFDGLEQELLEGQADLAAALDNTPQPTLREVNQRANREYQRITGELRRNIRSIRDEINDALREQDELLRTRDELERQIPTLRTGSTASQEAQELRGRLEQQILGYAERIGELRLRQSELTEALRLGHEAPRELLRLEEALADVAAELEAAVDARANLETAFREEAVLDAAGAWERYGDEISGADDEVARLTERLRRLRVEQDRAARLVEGGRTLGDARARVLEAARLRARIALAEPAAAVEPDLVRPGLDAAAYLSREIGEAQEDIVQLASAREEALAGTDREAAGIRAYNSILADQRKEITQTARHGIQLRRELSAEQAHLNDLEERHRQILSTGGAPTQAMNARIGAQRELLEELRATIIENDQMLAQFREQEPELQAVAVAIKNIIEALTPDAFDAFASETARLQENLEQWSVDVFRSMGDSLAEFVQTGEFGFRQLADEAVAQLLRILIQAQVIQPLLSLAAPSLADAAAFVAGAHTGGVIGRSHQNIAARGPRHHEMLALLLKGEEVLTESDPRHRRNIGAQTKESIDSWMRRLPRFHSGGVAGGGIGGGSGGRGDVNIVLRNESGRPLQAVDNGSRVSPQGMVREIVLRDAQVNGPITRGLKAAIR